jgi:HAD superfamily phosphoserine phosphatase-like hydrolase
VAAQARISVFDVDGTLIGENIGVAFVKRLLEQGECGLVAKTLMFLIYHLYKLGLLDFKYALLLGAWALYGLAPERVAALARDCFESRIKGRIFADALREIAEAKKRGETVILATGAHRAIAEPFAAFVGEDRLVAADSRLRNGRYTLAVLRPLPYRAGKRALVEKLIREEYGQAFVTVYSDEQKDLDLMDLADAPVAVNADAALRAYVASRGGRAVDFR